MIKKLMKIFTLMLLVSIVFTACKKDDAFTEQKVIDPTEQKILNFKAKLESGNKSSEMLSIDSTVWYVEAALNYTHCETDSLYVIKIDSSFYQIPNLDNYQISFSEIVDIYNNFENSINQILENTEGTNKKMLVSDIEFVEENEDKSSGNYLKLTTIITGQSPDENSEFDLTNFWYPVEGDGKCYIYEGEQIGKDASTQLDLELNKYSYLPYPYPYLTDIIIVGGANSSWNWNGNRNDCLNPDEMNYWLQKAREHAAILCNNIPGNSHSIINYDIYYQDMGGWYTHATEYTFGIWRDGRAIEH